MQQCCLQQRLTQWESGDNKTFICWKQNEKSASVWSKNLLTKCWLQKLWKATYSIHMIPDSTHYCVIMCTILIYQCNWVLKGNDLGRIEYTVSDWIYQIYQSSCWPHQRSFPLSILTYKHNALDIINGWRYVQLPWENFRSPLPIVIY